MKKYLTGLCLVLLSACSTPPTDTDTGDSSVCAKKVFTTNGCSNAGCHGGGLPYSFDLSADFTGAALVGKPSITTSCSGRLIIDKDKPDNSLVLTLTDAQRHQAPNDCGKMMPYGGKPISAEDAACLTRWVNDAAAKYPSVQVDYSKEFEPAKPEVYLAKVKYLLHGGAVTSTELDMVTQDPSKLGAVVQGWVGPSSASLTPEFTGKLTGFLRTAMQQDQIGAAGTNLGFPDGHWSASQSLLTDLTSSVTLTALDIVTQDRPFTEILTTRTWKMSNALLVLLAYADQSLTDQALIHTVNKGATGKNDLSSRTWYFDSKTSTASIPANCQNNKDGDDKHNTFTQSEFLRVLFGRVQCLKGRGTPMATMDYFYGVGTTGLPSGPAWTIQASDYAAYNDVTFVDAPAPKFYDLDTIRTMKNSGQFPTKLSRVGFFTSSVFLDNWPTNVDNQFRVTTNQSLIVGLGATFSPGDSTVQPMENGLPPTHVKSMTACYSCHRLMDPMRLYFGTSFSYLYRQPEATQTLAPSFAFLGSSAGGSKLDDFGKAMAAHPRFATAWVQKLCNYANSQPCDETDPEFIRIAQRFHDNNFKLRELVVDLFTSPLVTNTVLTQTFKSRRVLVSIARARHLCAAMTKRLSLNLGTLPSICATNEVKTKITGIPDDAFARGAVDPVLTASPSSFHAAAVEQVCTAIGQKAAGTVAFNDKMNPPPIDKVVAQIMGLGPSHPRYATVLAALTAHYNSRLNVSKKTTLESLAETITLACMTPDAMAIGF